MAYATTYPGLMADIIARTDDQSGELMSQLDQIIQLSETRLLRDLDLEAFQSEITLGTLSGSSRLLTRPSTVLKLNDVYLTVSSQKRLMKPRTYGFCQIFAPNSSDEDTPEFWAWKDENTLYFVPTADAPYTITGFGIVRPNGLGEEYSTTWLSLNVPDLLFFACMVEAENTLHSDAEAARYEGEYQKRLPAAQVEFRGLSRADYLMARRASSAVRIA